MQDKIKDLAYRLWQQAGSPEGRDLEHWLQAEAQMKAKPAKAPAKPKAVAPAKPKAVAPAKPKAAAPAKPKVAAKPKAAAKL